MAEAFLGVLGLRRDQAGEFGGLPARRLISAPILPRSQPIKHAAMRD
jgi:hypothetical protein